MNNESLVTIFTGVLALCTVILTVLARMQWKLLRQQFFVGNRPRVRVRRIRALTELLEPDGTLSDTPFMIEIVIVNQGASDAVVYHDNTCISLDRADRPLFNTVRPISSDSMCGRLESGQEKRFQFGLDPQKYALSILSNYPAIMSLYLIAEFGYRDELERPYKTGICRRFTMTERTLGILRERERFLVVENPDYEYED